MLFQFSIDKNFYRCNSYLKFISNLMVSMLPSIGIDISGLTINSITLKSSPALIRFSQICILGNL